MNSISHPYLNRLVVAAILAAATSLSLADSVTEFQVRNNGRPVESGVATIIADDQVIVSSKLAGLGDQYIIKDPDSGAEVIGALLAASESADLALLSVPGLGGSPLELAMDMPGPGRKIALAFPGGERREGTIHSLISASASEAARVQHTVTFSDGEFSAPLLNNCGELIGISQAEKRGVVQRRLEAPTTFGVASQLQVLKKFLADQSVSFAEAAAVCRSVTEQLESQGQEVEQLKKREEELAAEKEEVEKQREELENLSEEQKKALEQKARDLADREEELRKRQEELEKEQQKSKEANERMKDLDAEREKLAAEADRERRNKLYLVSGGSALLVILLFILMRRRRQLKRAAQDIESSREELSREQQKSEAVQAELKQTKATFPDFLLVGEDDSGHQHRIKIIGNALIRSEEGQVLGRSAKDADYVVNVEQVSRRHLKLSIEDGKVYVEDLGSYNGTAVNGEKLEPGAKHELNAGDTLRIATIETQVIFAG